MYTDNVAAPNYGLSITNEAVASFTVPDIYDGTSEFSATIYWGDGSSSSGTIVNEGGGIFEILGSHTYAQAGIYPVRVDLSQGWSTMTLVTTGFLFAQVIIPSVALYSVTYSGTNGYTLANDQTLTPYGTPQWLDQNLDGKIETSAGDHQYPYAYVSGKQMTVTAVFLPQNTVNPPAQIKVRAHLMALAAPIPFEAYAGYSQPYKVNLANGRYTLTINNLTMPSYTQGVPGFNIYWTYSLDGTNWRQAGKSSNHIYLTYEPMTASGRRFVSQRLQTVFADAASDLTGFVDSENPMDLLNIIWKNFSSLKASRALDNAALSYYKNWNILNTTYSQLVSRLDGQCGSWANLLLAAILADGLNSLWTIKFDTLVPTNAIRYNAFDNYGFLVRNWAFDNRSGLDVNYLSSIGNHSYNWTPGTTVQAHDEDGIPGQNEPNPASYFNNHQVIEVDTASMVYLFDPSYGKEYEGTTLNAALEQFQNAAIAGYFYQEEVTISGNRVSEISITPNFIGTLPQLEPWPAASRTY